MRRFHDLKPMEEKKINFKKVSKQVGQWLLVGRFSSIRELNDRVYKLREQGAQVETITTHLITNLPFRQVKYLLWKNTLTGIYLAETRIEDPIKKATDIQSKSSVNPELTIKP